MEFFLHFAIVALAAASAARHNALLPHPQEIRYTGGSLPVEGISVRAGAGCSAEDRFAAQQLASGLSAAAARLFRATGF